MLWNDGEEGSNTVSDSVVDLVFGISCKCLPVDHAFLLSKALQERLPWLADEEHTGMHQIHIMASGHGWERPSGEDALMLPSRRTKFILRLPKHRVDNAKTLIGKTLLVDGHELTVNNASIRLLSELTTLVSRYVVTAGEDESIFSKEVVDQLESMGIKPKKMLCGVEKIIKLDEQAVATRSVMVADISQEEALLLQQKGLGPHRVYGCGLFIPQKDINEV